MGVVAPVGRQEHTAIGEPLLPLVVYIAAVKDQDGAGSKRKYRRYFPLRRLSFGDHRIARQVSIVVQNLVQLRRAFGLLIFHPVQPGSREFDEGAVDAQQGIAKTETVPCAAWLSATRQQNAEDPLIPLAGTVLMGISE